MRRRIMISLGLLFGLCLLGDVIAMVSLNRSMQRLKGLAETHRIQLMRVTLSLGGVRVEADVLAHLAGREHSVEDRAEHHALFTESLDRCGSCHHAPGLEVELEEIRETFESYRAATDRLIAAVDPGDVRAAEQETLDIATELVLQTTTMADEAAKHLAVKEEDVVQIIRNAGVVLAGTLIVLLVCNAFVAIHLLRRLTRPVARLLAGIDRVRHGDSTYRFSVHADKEFRTLAGALNDAYTDLRSAHEGMLQAEKLAAVGRLSAGVAHEVFNPLASISSVAQMMRRHSTSKEQGEQLDLIMDEIARISRIVRQMMSFSKPAASETRKDVDVRALLEHATTLIGYDPRAREVAITQHYDTPLRSVRGDGERLLLVFTNVMINALDAMHVNGSEGGTLSIAAQEVNGRVVVAFTDDGPGMPEDAVAHAFEPFFTTKAKGGGTGLGLWICYEVIQRHAGSIRIDSHMGEGTTVTVELPRSTADESQLTAHYPTML